MSLNGHRNLYEEVVKKARFFHSNEFKSNAEFTGNFENDKNKDAFGRALKEYIESKTGICNPFNHRTLINILNAGIAPNARSSTVDALSKFIGYEDFETFSKMRKKPESKSYLVLAFFSGVLVLGIAVSFVSFKSKKVDVAIEEVIINANQAQFDAYKTLPLVNVQILKKYYTESGSAFNVIKDILNRSAQLKRTVNLPHDNPSYYTIHDIRILEKKGDRVVAVSEEHWYLRWFCLETNNYIKKYDVTNSQVYILVKENEEWKIDSNDYTGTAVEIIK